MFTYSIASYAIAFASILYWILSVSNLMPEISIDQEPRVSFIIALVNNLALISLFGVQHSIMARPWFKAIFRKYFPEPIERSTFVLISGILLFIMVTYWQPMGGMIWNVEAGLVLHYTLYVLFFAGWSIMFISTFLINHFDLFGMRQTFMALRNKPYTDLEFRVTSLYKYMRHPLYFGILLGMWATPIMSLTHLLFASACSIYVVIGTTLEEKDLVDVFDEKYTNYQASKPMLIPFTKIFKKRTKGQVAASKVRS